jgi:hypothetical protein
MHLCLSGLAEVLGFARCQFTGLLLEATDCGSDRGPDGKPGVVMTSPRLEDGTPFPTLYYLTDPRLTAEASRQESAVS